MTNGLEGYVSPFQEVELHFPIDWFVHMANDVYDYFKSGDQYSVSFKPFLTEIRDPSLAVELLQVRFTGIKSLCSWLSLKGTRDQKEMLPNMLKEHCTIYLRALGVCRKVSTQNESKIDATDIDLFYPGSHLILKSSQPEPSDLQSSTRPGTCKHVLAPVQREQTDLDKESRRFLTHRRPVHTSEPVKEAWYR